MLAIRQRTKLIVGIDYGTTYSGISFALSNAADFKDIHPWTKYPGSSAHRSEHCEKAPSWVAFADENEGFLDENAWGYQIEPGMKTYAWTKLLLDDKALQTEYDDPDLQKTTGSGMMALPVGKSAKDVVTEYFRGMYAMFNKAIIGFVGQDKLDTLPIDFWLTVPATWSERAKLLTRAAATDAGFASRSIDRIFLIPEPEAAAHLALKSSIHHVEDLVQKGTGVMVCDCGGGTVDITTYEIQKITPMLKLREICVGIGGKCGGTFIDRNLYKLLTNRFGDSFTSLGPEQTGPGSQFMDQFENKKKDFSMKSPSKRAQRLFLPMTDLPPRSAAGGGIDKWYDRRFSAVLLSQEDMKALFDPVVDIILRLVRDQVEQVKRRKEPAIETIVLVGGFGSSPYVRERLLDWCADARIRLTTPWSGGWSAVVCGAVLRGLEGSIVTQKKCRRHYGFHLGLEYNPDIHMGYDKSTRHVWYCPFTDKQWLSGFIAWKINKGDVVDDETVIKHKVSQSFPADRLAGGKGTIELYACSLDEAPDSIENDRVEKVGEIQYVLDDLDPTKLEVKTDDKGTKQYNAHLTLTIKLSDEGGVLAFVIEFDGKQVGTAQLGFSFT